MESLNPEFALYGRKNECTRTDMVFFPYLRSEMRRFPFYHIAYTFPNRKKTQRDTNYHSRAKPRAGLQTQFSLGK